MVAVRVHKFVLPHWLHSCGIKSFDGTVLLVLELQGFLELDAENDRVAAGLVSCHQFVRPHWRVVSSLSFSSQLLDEHLLEISAS